MQRSCLGLCHIRLTWMAWNKVRWQLSVLCCGSSFAASRTQVWKWARRRRDKDQANVVTNFLFPPLRSCCTPDVAGNCCQLCTEGAIINSKRWGNGSGLSAHICISTNSSCASCPKAWSPADPGSQWELGVSGKWGWKAYFFCAQQMNGTTMMGIGSQF